MGLKLRSAILSLQLVAGLVLGLISTGCCTIVSGRDQNVRITSEPAGATILVDGKPCGVTPAKFKLLRKEKHDVQVVMAGFEPAQATLKPGINPWLFGNVLIGGLIGIGIDAVTGSWETLYPGEVNVKMRQAPLRN